MTTPTYTTLLAPDGDRYAVEMIAGRITRATLGGTTQGEEWDSEQIRPLLLMTPDATQDGAWLQREIDHADLVRLLEAAVVNEEAHWSPLFRSVWVAEARALLQSISDDERRTA